nr:SDR family NAD(P)-dependent oxidoreductase [Chitinophagaceae bacterium]
MFSLQHKTAVVTGGGSGIGRAIALLFARQGATVHIFELSTEAG